MNLHVLSDLHLEFGDFEVPSVEADAVVVAGDIHVGTRAVPWLVERLPDVPIIYVLGNHELYGNSFPGLVGKLKREAGKSGRDIRVLECDKTTVGDVTFLGCTLWSDFKLTGERVVGMAAASQLVTDFQKIRVEPEYRRLRPRDAAAIHARSVSWLGGALNEPSGPTVVVTHHAPSELGVPPRYRSDPWTAAFASHLDDFVAASGAALWIHGHTHFAVDLELGSTRLVSNPRGYVGEEVKGFVSDLVVEV